MGDGVEPSLTPDPPEGLHTGIGGTILDGKVHELERLVQIPPAESTGVSDSNAEQCPLKQFSLQDDATRWFLLNLVQAERVILVDQMTKQFKSALQENRELLQRDLEQLKYEKYEACPQR